MKRSIQTDKLILFSYFIVHIAAGTLFLSLPLATCSGRPIPVIDALFTAVSAVCVTGLVTLQTSLFSAFGQGVILFLIQAGGLGIITFTTLYIAIPGRRMSLKSRKLVSNYFLETIDHEPVRIIRSILMATFSVEALGTLALYFGFSRAGVERPIYTAIFHSISAFCNAGFSLFDDSLAGVSRVPGVLVPIMLLIITGGIGFLVLRDFFKALMQGKRLTEHSRIVLGMTGLLLVFSTVFFFFVEGDRTENGVLQAVFQSVTTRTAGFNTIDQKELHPASAFVTILLMFIGGGSGSTAGGIKVTTMFLLLSAVFCPYHENDGVRIAGRNVARKKISLACTLVIRALFILLLSLICLLITDAEKAFLDVLYEVVSAMGTVGLSRGITPLLSTGGKIVIILTMFAGRVGLFSMVMSRHKTGVERAIKYPEAEVMIG